MIKVEVEVLLPIKMMFQGLLSPADVIKMIYRKAGKEKIACFVSTFRLKFWTKNRNWNGANQG